ncbi:C40 family peptidase [Streptomyces sp. NPDC001820]|uniref:C40 family peptidase n=1 Tax=Streptomyces sp. NPDC001820 TaxID=3364613 RepID=UPI0036B585A2
MTGRLLHSVCTAALATATAVAAVPAAAEPAPTPAPAPPTTVSGMLTALQTLYRQAEEAGETYKATGEELRRQRARTARLARELAGARKAVVAARADAGRLAREQYRGRSELSSYLGLLLSRNPKQALDQHHLIERAAAHQLATMAGLKEGARRAAGLAAASREALDKELTLAAKQKKARDDATAQLRDVEKMLASLSADEIAEVAALERTNAAKAQEKLLASGVLGGRRTPTSQGRRALKYAVEQIGKPYVWGAEGPQSYDCSGLTSQAWARAGREIPRTSQEQWAQLPKVSLRALRPGDLVIYYPKATHVAIYLGEGKVVQAPRPGTKVKVSPIAANPLIGAVRPDPDGSPLSTYTPPRLPRGATAGQDDGYSAAGAPDTSAR